MKRQPAPRIYCIPAAQAPVVAVFRRGPSNWSSVGRWDLDKGRYEHGAWLGGRIFPRRSDLSPDGRYLCYFAHKPSARWPHGEAYVAVSRLPWLFALHAFGTCGTWTRGYYFVNERERDAAEEKLPVGYGLRSIRPEQFASERRRGWDEATDSPARDPADMWDQRRNARLCKRQPGGSRLLRVESIGWAGGEWTRQAIDGLRVVYALQDDAGIQLLPQLQWADWDRQGRLLAATRSGHLQVWEIGQSKPKVVFDEDLTVLEPDCRSAPSWAQRW